MKAENYPFVVRPLPYEYDALVPVLDAETLTFHHDRHYKTYVDNLNNALADYPELQRKSLTELLTDIDSLPGAIRMAVRNNGGGVYNHELYFDSMKSPVGQEPSGALAEAIDRDFGSYRQWKEQMKQSAVSKFGSGWACSGSGRIHSPVACGCLGTRLLSAVSEQKSRLCGRLVWTDQLAQGGKAL